MKHGMNTLFNKTLEKRVTKISRGKIRKTFFYHREDARKFPVPHCILLDVFLILIFFAQFSTFPCIQSTVG